MKIEERQIKLTVKQALQLYKTNPEYRNTLLSVFTDKELEIEPKYPKSIMDLDGIDGYYISDSACITDYYDEIVREDADKNLFATLEQAKSALAFAQLSQLIKEMNNGWISNWNKGGNFKYTISRINNNLKINSYTDTFNSLCFKTQELADFSLKHHEQLWKNYYELD